MDANPSPPQELYQDFLERYPDYPRTRIVDDLRRRDFSRLERSGEVYLDYTGSGLYPESLVRRHADWRDPRSGQPSLREPASRASTGASNAVAADPRLPGRPGKYAWSSPPMPAMP